MSRYISFLVLLVVIVVLGLLLYKVMAGFLIPMFLAAILVVIFRPTHDWVLEKCKGKQAIASGVTTFGILLVVLIPITLLLLLGIYEARQVAKFFESGSLLEKVEQVRESLGLEVPEIEQLMLTEEYLDTLDQRFTWVDLTVKKDELGYFQGALERLETRISESEDTKQIELLDKSRPALEEIYSEIDKTQELLGDVDSPLVEQDELKSIEADFRALLPSLNKKFEQFKTGLLGGGIWAKLKMLANPSGDQLEDYESKTARFLSEKILAIGGATTVLLGKLGLGLAIMTISLYFFLLDGPRIIQSLKGLSPIDDEHEEELIREFHNVSRAVVIATLLSALAQGFLAGIGYYFVGMDSVFLLTLITTCLALVPFLGAASVWIPVCLWIYLVDNNTWGALGLGLYGATCVSMIDNLIKPMVLHGQSNLHPLLALLSVLGGVTALGPIGILVGPMIVVFLQTLLNILRRELSQMPEPSADTLRRQARWNSMSSRTE